MTETGSKLVGPTAAVIFHLPGSPKEGKCHLHLDLLNCGINVSRKLRARILSVLGKGYHHCHSSHALGTLHSFSITWSECSYPSSIRIVFSHTLLSDSGSHFPCDFFFFGYSQLPLASQTVVFIKEKIHVHTVRTRRKFVSETGR